MTLQLGILQATLVGIGVGLTIMGVISFRSIQEEAVRKAVDAAVKEAENQVGEVLTRTSERAGKEESISDPEPITRDPGS